MSGVAGVVPSASAAPPRTVAILVENDSPPPRKVRRRDGQLADARRAQAALTDVLAARLAARRLTVVPAGRNADLVLRCRILQVRGGDAALRVAIGYGAGKAVLQLEVSLDDGKAAGAAPATLLRFETDSTTGRMPGAGLGVAGGLASGGAAGAIGPALGVPGAMKQGLAQEIDQTADHIDKELGKYFAARNWPYPPPVPARSGATPGA